MSGTYKCPKSMALQVRPMMTSATDNVYTQHTAYPLTPSPHDQAGLTMEMFHSVQEDGQLALLRAEAKEHHVIRIHRDSGYMHTKDDMLAMAPATYLMRRQSWP
jgi:hypothetical protein